MCSFIYNEDVNETYVIPLITYQIKKDWLHSVTWGVSEEGEMDILINCWWEYEVLIFYGK